MVDALRKGMKVYFVGHSLGGILATMAAIRTYHENYDNTKYAKACTFLFMAALVALEEVGNFMTTTTSLKFILITLKSEMI